MYARKRLTVSTPAAYEIRIQGCLDKNWSDRMDGVTIQVQTSPEGVALTVVTGAFQDQAALAGVLSTLYDLGLPLLSVECLGAAVNNQGQPPPPTAERSS